ncbi:MAG TPA: class I SAM-dependent methyltransferase [Porticoccaceae bacterium]|nr:class I SAM-dependent methyltransferase [Porticoccaceae bacterium]
MHIAGNLYADLSAFYDQFCAEVDYAEQCDFAARAFACFASSGGRDYLDLACGTGQHLRDMAARGFAPHGLDNSAEMLALAAARCPSATLLLCDLAAFEQVAAFDLISCFLYSIHYSHPTAALAETLRRAHRALKPGGVLIFNAVDCRGIRNNSGVITRVATTAGELRFQSRWHYRGEGDVLDLNLAISQESPEGARYWRDHHTMTAITFPHLLAMLADTGFLATLLEHDYRVMAPWAGESFNAIVVATKPCGFPADDTALDVPGGGFGPTGSV